MNQLEIKHAQLTNAVTQTADQYISFKIFMEAESKEGNLILVIC